jgi:broad specificity phosphatase PhoE
MSDPLTIVLVRHGQSRANTRELSPAAVGDHTIPLTELGRTQARDRGRAIGARFLRDALVYCSPYRRARETLAGLLEGADVTAKELRVYEDPRLREVDHGYDDWDAQQELRRTHGWFYYRFKGGESPADCFDRTSGFLDSMMRQVERKRAKDVLIVTHGLTIRCFVMRFFHLTVEQFDSLGNPANCDAITIGAAKDLGPSVFERGRWGVVGLRLRPPGED